MFIFLVVSCFVFINRYSGSQLSTYVKFQTAPLIQEPSQEELDLPPPRRQFLEDSEDQSRRSYRYTHLLDGQLISPAAAAEWDCLTIPRALQFNSLNTSGDSSIIIPILQIKHLRQRQLLAKISTAHK